MTTDGPVATCASLAEAILYVRDRVAYVQKQRGKELNYTYANVETVIRELRGAMNEARLVFVPTKSQQVENTTFQTSKGSTMRLARVHVTYQLMHAPSKDSMTVEVIGEAADTGDKAINKCFAAALKLALLQAFLLERGDMDPDEHQSRFGSNGHHAADEPEWWQKFVASMKGAEKAADVRKYVASAKKRMPPLPYMDKLVNLEQEHLRRVGALAPGK